MSGRDGLTRADALAYARAVAERDRWYCILSGFGEDAAHPVEQVNSMEGLRALADAAGASVVRGHDSEGVHYRTVIDGTEFIYFETGGVV